MSRAHGASSIAKASPFDESQARGVRRTTGDLRRHGQEQLVDESGADQSAEQVRPALADDDVQATFAEHLDDGGRVDLVSRIRP